MIPENDPSRCHHCRGIHLAGPCPRAPSATSREAVDAKDQAAEAWLADYVASARKTHQRELLTRSPEPKGINWEKLNAREFPKKSEP
jgi:hypothetical protein